MGSRSEGEGEEESEVSVTDVALLSTQEDEDFSVAYQTTAFDFSVLDDVIAETDVIEISQVSDASLGKGKQQLLASFFRK